VTKENSDDLDRTDELPVLLETVAFGAAEDLVAVPDAAGSQTALYAAPATEAPAPPANEDDRAAIAALEREVSELTSRARELELQLAGKERSLDELERHVAEFRAGAASRVAVEQHLTQQLAERDARVEELAAERDTLRSERDARSAELAAAQEGFRVELDARVAELAATRDGLRAELDARVTEIEALTVAADDAQRARAELEARAATAEREEPAIEKLREDNAALTAYIATRRETWERTEAARAALAARVAALEHELADGVVRLRKAEELAARESSRAVDLRTELIGTARRLEDAEREIKELRRATLDRAEPPTHAPIPAAPEVRPAPPAPPPAPPADPASASDAAIEVIAQLEAQVEHKRQQVAAQMIELREREQRINALTAELEAARLELKAARGEIGQLLAATASLERAVADKDRALEARDARINTLHDEISKRVATTEQRAAPGIQRNVKHNEHRIDLGAEGGRVPALICLTGDAEKRVALTRNSTVIGRGAHCDLQILTHFVSREHARIVVNAGTVLIEDLGSRNGVFVNSVRVDRHALEHGDLITIGETQFRFIESMAH
jgi:chromosome segregation ATPase